MARKKILVCNSLSFVMSNFIRYLLYHTKEFDVISIDEINDVSSLKKRYVNQYNKFYAGKIDDLDFLKQIMMIENPDIIINGMEYNNPYKIVIGSWNLSQLNKPVIQLKPSIDVNNWWSAASSTIINKAGYVIETPNMFGRWQNSNEGLAKIIKNVTTKDKIDVESGSNPWTYAGDLCSYMWFLIENITKDLMHIPHYMKSPSVELDSEKIVLLIAETFQTNVHFNIVKEKINYIKEFKSTDLPGWEPDEVDSWRLLENTVGWYKKNQWALCL